MDDLTPALLRFVMLLPVFVPAIVIHEYAHAWVAYRCGDMTAKEEGRLTLDPLVHFEFMGSAMFFVSTMTGVGFGWAKPVPVTFSNLQGGLRDIVRVAAAGPATNVVQAIGWVALLGLLRLALGRDAMAEHFYSGLDLPSNLPGYAVWIALYGLLINLSLTLFNLMPIPPLDGGRIAVATLRYPLSHYLAQLEPIGPFLIFILLQSPPFGLGVFQAVGAPIFGFVMQNLARLLT